MAFKIAIYLLLLIAEVGTAQPLLRQSVLVPERFKERFGVDRELEMPAGYRLQLFALDSLQRPRFMAKAPNKDLFVADMKARRVIGLRTSGSDHVTQTWYATPPLDTAHSLVFLGDTMLVAQPSLIRKLVDLDLDGYYETEIPFISGLPTFGVYDHYTRTIVVDSVHGRLFVSVGASCNACREVDSERASILRFNLDGTSRAIYASGLRNAIGLYVDESGTLWATNADRDFLGDGAPTELFTRVDSGSFHGWPFAFGNKQWIDLSQPHTPEFDALLPFTHEDSLRVESMAVPRTILPAHSTPMGIGKEGEDFLVAIHGSSASGRSTGIGYSVMKGTPGGGFGDFIRGFLTDSATYKFWGRPCGILDDLITSDAGIPAIYRIVKEQSLVRTSLDRRAGTLYPNPANDRVRIEGGADARRVRIIDVLGRLVADIALEASELDISHVPAGTYRVIMDAGAASGGHSLIIIR